MSKLIRLPVSGSMTEEDIPHDNTNWTSSNNDNDINCINVVTTMSHSSWNDKRDNKKYPL